MLSGNRGHFLNLGKMENVIENGCANSDFLFTRQQLLGTPKNSGITISALNLVN